MTVLSEYIDQISFTAKYLSYIRTHVYAGIFFMACIIVAAYMYRVINCVGGLLNFGTAKTVPAGLLPPSLQDRWQVSQ